MQYLPYYLTITVYLILISMNVAIVDATSSRLAEELLPIWIPWVSIWVAGALAAFWLHTAISARKPILRYALPIIYAILAIVFSATASGQDWLARLIPMNALIALAIVSSTRSFCSRNAPRTGAESQASNA